MTWFDAFRGEFGFTYYGEQRTPVTVDVQFVIVIYTCVLISIATIIAAAGIRGRERWYTLLRVTYGLSVGSTILLCIYGYCWQTGNMKIHSPYIFRSHEEIDGTLGIHIGLRKLNVTLSGMFEGSKSKVKYNEEISLTEVRGPQAELKHCLNRGMPLPILNIVEYLSVDAGFLRWGRSFTMAGFFTYVLLWTSFSFWLLANIMMCSVVFYGAFMFTLTGLTMMLSTLCYHVLQPQYKIRLIDSDTEFQMSYGICFWAVLLIGMLTVLIGLIILIIDYKIPKTAAKYILLETQFVKEEVYSSEVRRGSIMNNFPPKDLGRRLSAPVLCHTNHGFDFNEHPLKNPIFKEYGTNDLGKGLSESYMHRSSTSPGNILNTTSSFPRSSFRGSMRSLDSINEHAKEESIYSTYRRSDDVTHRTKSPVSSHSVDMSSVVKQNDMMSEHQNKRNSAPDEVKVNVDIETFGAKMQQMNGKTEIS